MSINGSGEIATSELSIEERKGAIVMWLGEKYVIMPPEQAVSIGDTLSDYGYSAAGLARPSAQKILTPVQLETIENRIALVINNLQEKKRPMSFIAKEVAGIVLREVM